VNGVEASDFVVTGLNVIKSAVIDVQNANPFYWVKVSTGAGSGTIRLDLFDNGNITDSAGNSLTNGPFTGESFTVAKTTVDFAAPTINPFPNGVTNNPFTSFSWSSVRNAQAYEIFVARDSGFSQIVFAQTVTETSLLPQSALADGTYYARIRAYNSDLNPGKFSKTYTFSVDSTPPPAPTLLSPANGASTPRRPWLKWSAVSGSAKYQIEVDNNADFSSPEFSASTNKTTSQAKNLLARSYYWRVRVSDAAGNWSDWSAAYLFTPR
jgi:predicted phage tail protein